MSIFKLYALPAEEGDCLVISYGPREDDLAHVVIDAGHTATQKHLKAHLEDIGAHEIEVLVVTHVDADHIEGILGLVGTYGPLAKPKDVWFNGYRHLIEDLQAFGPVQGETLTTALLTLPWNAAIGGKAIRLRDDGEPMRLPDLKHGLCVTVLSPSKRKLQAMEPTWKSACEAAGLMPGTPADKTDTRPGLEVMGADLVAIAATKTARDGAKANGTSIALLLEYAGKSVVLGADAHPDVLTASLKTLGCGMPFHVDLFKLPHHGSQSNVTLDLLAAVDCHDFVVSTNGKRFNHPDEVAMARVITSSSEKKRIWFNYRQKKTECWVDSHFQEKYGYSCRFPDNADTPLVIDVSKIEA